MSGSKRTSWSWEQSRAEAERRRRERLAAEARARVAARQLAAQQALEKATQRGVRRQVAALQPQVSHLAAQLRAATGQVDAVTRETFGTELAEAAALAREAEQAADGAKRLAALSGSNLVEHGISADSPELAGLGPLIGQLQESVTRVEQIRFTDGPARQREVAARLSAVGNSVAAAESFAAPADVRGWSQKLRQLWQLVRDGELDRAEQEAARLGAAVTEAAAQVQAAQRRRDERLAVLDALRDTCRYLGYRELNADELDDAVEEDEPTWRLLVDTRTKGRVAFYVEAEEIRAESTIGVRGDHITGDYCFAEFRRVEAELAAGHGLRTHFTSDAVPRPAPVAGAAAHSSAAERYAQGHHQS